ncbi:MAG: hypothetical protein ABJK11_00280 [Balneola sp.]
MNNSQILKLIFHHDQRLDQLQDRNANRTKEQIESTLADFMKPDPTYSRLYFTGTDLENEKFGLNVLSEYKGVISSLEEGLDTDSYQTNKGSFDSLDKAISGIELGEVIVIGEGEVDFDISTLHIDTNSNVGHLKTELKEVLELGFVVIYKEQAKNGFDLHVFSKKNIYPKFFNPLQNMLPDAFRFFSINGKKFRSERHFYFETWTLARPPHGFEEVFVESVL